MPSQLPEQKVAKSLTDNCADVRYQAVPVAHHMTRQHSDIQTRFFNTLLAYVYAMAHRYEIGAFNSTTYELVRLCKKIKDYALSDEFTVSVYSHYGDYENVQDLNDAINLDIFDMAY